MCTEVLSDLGERSTPDGFHLSVRGLLHHRFVIELVLGLETTSGPKNRLRGMCEVSTTQVRRWVWLFPGNLVQQFESQLLHHKSDRINNVPCTRYPDATIRLQTLWQVSSHEVLNRCILSTEVRRSQSPLLTVTILPAWHVMPPFDRKWGGSAKIRSAPLVGKNQRKQCFAIASVENESPVD